MAGQGGIAPPPADLETAMLLTTPLAYGPPDRCCPGVTSLENSRSTVELQADGRRATRLKISSPSRILDSRAYGGLALRSGRPTLPGWASPSDLCRSSPIFKCGARQRAAASWLRGPAGADGVLSPLHHAHRPSPVGGYNKKTPASFRARGFQFFQALLHVTIAPAPVRSMVRFPAGLLLVAGEYEPTNRDQACRWRISPIVGL